MNLTNFKNILYKTILKRLGVFLIFFSLIPTPSLADLGEVRSLKIWNRPIDYQFSIKQDLKVDYDGEAFVKQIDGKKVNFVILNRAFFEKEAKKLFKKFSQMKEANSLDHSLSKEEFLFLEQKLKSLQVYEMGEGLKLTVRKLQSSLEYRAWYQIYQNSLAESSSETEAKSRFAGLFSQIRMKTIEYHEVSHLIDLSNIQNHHSPDFARFTEVNAFYTELAYGENPWDVMNQAMIGILDEIDQKRMIDYSTEKVLATIELLKTNRSLNGTLQKLISLNKKDYSSIGHTLHQHSYQNSTSLAKTDQK